MNKLPCRPGSSITKFTNCELQLTEFWSLAMICLACGKPQLQSDITVNNFISVLWCSCVHVVLWKKSSWTYFF